jgi:cytidylate kinase
MMRFVITIDGPAASGKSTAARLLAEKLNADFLDTGSMYRAVTLAAMDKGVDLSNETLLLYVIDKTDFVFEPSPEGMIVKINCIDVTEKIRDPQVTANARYIASSPKARQRLVEMQRQFAGTYERIVTEGRDQGTVAFPDADVKFFLDASLDERAKRRQADLSAKGVEQSIAQIRQDIEERDKSDESRSVGPLKPAHDAVIVDTTNLSIDQVVGKLLEYVKRKCPSQ